MSDPTSAQPAPQPDSQPVPEHPVTPAAPGYAGPQPGYPVQPGYPTQPGHPGPGPAKPSNGLATAGFVLGLLGFLGSFIPLLNIGGIVVGIVGVILAAVGLVKAKKLAGAGRGLALTGIILGGLALVVGVVINVAFVGAVNDALDDATTTTVLTPTATASDGDVSSDEQTSDEATPDDESTSDDEVGTTRDNPAPLGSAISDDDWTVTVNSVKTIKKDKYDQKAAKGSVLLLVNVTATYTGDDAQGDSAWANVKFVSADGTTVDSSDGSTLFIAEDAFDNLKTVYNGGSVTGDEIIEVPADWQDGVLAVSPAMFSDDTFVAVK